jgi:hypothetical protein
VIGADNALLTHEAERRLTEHAIRREARIDLARRGLIGTETEIVKWRAEGLDKWKNEQTVTVEIFATPLFRLIESSKRNDHRYKM